MSYISNLFFYKYVFVTLKSYIRIIMLKNHLYNIKLNFPITILESKLIFYQLEIFMLLLSYRYLSNFIKSN